MNQEDASSARARIISSDCPYNSDDDDKKVKKDKKKSKEGRKMAFHNKKGHSYCVTWDSDESSSDEDESDNEKKSTKKKALASIAINNKPSLYDTSSTPSCFMAKPSKVSSNESESESEDEEEPSKEDLLEMLEEANSFIDKKRKEYKELRKKHQALEQNFDELNATHERLMEAHEKLEKAHSKLDKAYSTLLDQSKKEPIQTSQVGVTCDLLNETFYTPIVVAPANPSCSSSNATSTSNDDFTCNASLMIENETLKREVNEFTRVLGKAYGGEARLLKCLGSQRFSLNKERLGYTPKNGKAAFATHKTSFMKSNGRF
jgi:chromosome segregation ATPase